MIIAIICTSLILTTIFWGYVAFTSVITKDTDKVLVPAVLGIILYYLAYRFLYSYNYILIQKNYKSTWVFGYYLIMGLAGAISIEVVRNEMLYFLNKYLKWSGRTRDNVAFAMGYSLCFAIHSLGTYAWSLYSRIVTGNMYFKVENGLLFCNFLEVITNAILSVGMTFILQYGIIKRKKIVYTIIAVMLHMFSEIILHLYQYVGFMPRLLADILYILVAVAVFYYGYGLITKIRRKKSNTIVYRSYQKIVEFLNKIKISLYLAEERTKK